MPDDIHVKDLLQAIGLYENEVRVYLALAEVGKSGAQLLSKRIGIPRTTAYAALDSLVKKGLVSISQRGSTSYFTANNPNAVLRLVENQKREINAREKCAQELTKILPAYFMNRNFSLPRLQFFEGRQNIENLLFDSLEQWRDSAAKYNNTWWGYQDHTFAEQYYKWIEHAWATKAENETYNFLSNYSEIELGIKKKKVPNRDIRLIPPEFEFTSSIWLVGDYILLLMTRQEPHYVFQLNDAVFAASLRLLFQLVWQMKL